MAKKRVNQEECLFCGASPCSCEVPTERRNRALRRQVESDAVLAAGSPPNTPAPTNRDKSDTPGSLPVSAPVTVTGDVEPDSTEESP